MSVLLAGIGLLALAAVWVATSEGGQLVERAKYLPGGVHYRGPVGGGLELGEDPPGLLDTRDEWRESA